MVAPVMPPGRTAPGAGVGVGDGVGSMDQMNAAAMRPTSRVAIASANPLIREAMMARIRTTATFRTISQFHHGGNTAGAGDGAGDGASTSLVTWSMDTIPSGGVTGGTKESSPELTRVNRAGRVVSEGPSRSLGRVNRRNVAENILSGTRLARTGARIVVGLASPLAWNGAVKVSKVAGWATSRRTRWICCSADRANCA